MQVSKYFEREREKERQTKHSLCVSFVFLIQVFLHFSSSGFDTLLHEGPILHIIHCAPDKGLGGLMILAYF